MPLPKPFIGALVASFVMLQILFLANMAYLFGTAYHGSSRVDTFKILYVDYDDGVIGNSVMPAYHGLASPGFLTIAQQSPSDYPTPSDIRQVVCKGKYWGAIYANHDASSRLSSALTSPTYAEHYNGSDALTYVWNSAKYAAQAQTIYSDLEILVEATRIQWSESNGTAALMSANTSDKFITQALLNPISSSSIDIKPTNQGVRFYYNSLTMVIPILQQFFFIMALNGIFGEFKAYRELSIKAAVILRFALSLAYTFIGSLCMAGYIWGFREDWHVNGHQFALTWMAIWLVAHINFLLIDAVTVIVSIKFMPFVILTWIILNVSSTVAPFNLSPGFYRIGYAFPAHELYEILLDIWTEDCFPSLHRDLPILWSWWVVGLAVFVVGMRRRYTKAVAQDGDQEKEEVRVSGLTA
ncbi:hypothetical protein N7532_001198 [Penicillium argentinense]|uniref:DUF3533 domain-containing protein n=1 Tax=Penicillium argentinense TaxID=1131581 RepID=A0A9W9G243_9EURO|nr:uncharacterized protein N7532_001198 [Penicillium argentinense]KAJ5110663.1 hypothetical protein N7532_001198 [Penicillium argentinense]